LGGKAQRRTAQKPEDPGNRAAVYGLLSPKSKRKRDLYTYRRAGKTGKGRGGRQYKIDVQQTAVEKSSKKGVNNQKGEIYVFSIADTSI